jgi:hypothetical protein
MVCAGTGVVVFQKGSRVLSAGGKRRACWDEACDIGVLRPTAHALGLPTDHSLGRCLDTVEICNEILSWKEVI